MQIHPAGTAFHFANLGRDDLAASLIGKLGNDPAGDFIRNWATEHHIPCTFFDSTSPTGIVVTLSTIHEAPDHSRPWRIATSPTSCDFLTPADVVSCREMIRASDVLIVDGYRYLKEPSASAADTACHEARQAHKLTVFDVVPHDLPYRTVPRRLDTIIPGYDVVILEVGTAIALLGHHVATTSHVLSDAQLVLQQLVARFSSVEVWVLRFGEDNMDEELIAQAHGSQKHRNTGYTSAPSKIGYGEHVTCCDVRGLLDGSLFRESGENPSDAEPRPRDKDQSGKR
jgi:sugar/nucleoside kinase (ribokinase family)